MVSQSSKFERSIFSGDGVGSSLTPLESMGFQLFVEKYDCMSCHDIVSSQGYSEAFGDELVNIGLDASYEDNGAGALDGDASKDGKFKIPNLRNIALTAPYMHDGRFASLEEVIDHYSDAVAAHPNLDERLKDPVTGLPRILNITTDEKNALVAFLHTLTDHTFISDPKFSDPFTK
jgi:cytochrome c peroxidase